MRVAGEQRLGSTQRGWTVLQKLPGHLPCSCHKLFGSHNLTDQSQAVGFLRVEDASSEQQVACALLSDVRDQKTRNYCRDKADAHLGVAKLRFRDRQSEIAQGRQPSASGNGRAIHRRDGRLRKIIERTEEPCHGFRVLNILLMSAPRKLLEVLQVHAGTKRLSCAGKNQNMRG